MNLAIIGSGGREHAICHKLNQSPKVKKLVCIPGNAGTRTVAKNIEENILNFDALYKIVRDENIDIIIVGPEVPLVKGIVDYFEAKKIKIFGPSKFAAQLEGSKAFMKNLCKKYNIPTANFGIYNSFQKAKNFIKKNGTPVVVKADGLAAGKGVSICNSTEDAFKKVKEILDGKYKSSRTVVLEEFLEGEEISYFVIVDENSYKFFGVAQDHKKAGEGDVGPNTGGMGAYSPVPFFSNDLERKINKKIIEPTLKALKDKGSPYKGILYAGLMIKKKNPYLIEYNVRLGDPECQTLLMRLKTDLFEIVNHTIKNKLKNLKIKWSSKKCVSIVLCAKGYPSKYIKNSEIKNLQNIKLDNNNQIFHAGTYEKNNKIFSSGGRVLNIVSVEKNFVKARKKILGNLDRINWIDGFFRKDIGWRIINKK